MTQLYGNRWLSNFGTSDIGDVWFKALKDLQVNQIKQGFDALLAQHKAGKGHAWPPNVFEFRALCLKATMELPDVHQAFQEYLNAHYHATVAWSHPIVSMASHAVQKNVQALDDNAKRFELFSQVYKPLLNRAIGGETFEGNNRGLLDDTPVDKTVARSYLNELYRLLKNES